MERYVYAALLILSFAAMPAKGIAASPELNLTIQCEKWLLPSGCCIVNEKTNKCLWPR